MNTTSLDVALDAAMQLSDEQREILVEILSRRAAEARRAEVAAEARASLAAYRAGELRPQHAEDVIRELRSSLERDE